MQSINLWSLWTITGFVWILLALTLILMLYCFFLRAKNNRYKEKQDRLYSKWENMVFRYLEGENALQDIMDAVPRSDYAVFLQFLKRYLFALKGTDFEKLSALVTDTDLLQYLASQLASGDEQTRSGAAFFMGAVRAKGMKEQLLASLRDADEGVYYNCTLSLARIGATDALENILEQYTMRKRPSKDLLLSILLEFGVEACQPLLRILKKGANAFSIPLILDVLGHYRYYPAGEEILAILNTADNADVRLSSIMALGNIEYLDAMPSLRKCLNDEDWRICSSAIWALGKIGDSTIEDKLLEYLNDKSWWVRYRAAEALYNISQKGREKLVEIANGGDGEASRIAKMYLIELEVGN